MSSVSISFSARLLDPKVKKVKIVPPVIDDWEGTPTLFVSRRGSISTPVQRKMGSERVCMCLESIDPGEGKNRNTYQSFQPTPFPPSIRIPYLNFLGRLRGHVSVPVRTYIVLLQEVM